MSLVAYESSDESDSGEDGRSDGRTIDAITTTQSFATAGSTNYRMRNQFNGNNTVEDDDENVSGSNNVTPMFARLPKPQKRDYVMQEADDAGATVGSATDVGLKGSKTVKITVPSLSEFEDVREPVAKVMRGNKPSQSSGLFAMLPLPKNTVTKTLNRSLVPHSVAKQQTSVTKAKPDSKSPRTTRTVQHDKAVANTPADQDDDSADEGESSVPDFFSLDNLSADKNVGVASTSRDAVSDVVDSTTDQPSSSSETPDQAQNSVSWASSSYADSNTVTDSSEQQQSAYGRQSTSFEDPEISQSDGVVSSSATDPASVLNDEEFLRFLGKNRSKREEIQFIDVAQDDQIPKYEEWLVKALTEEEANRPSRKKGAMPTSTQRRKHQITYLAYQAKEREIELKNQWAENRLSRRQTQSKYGF